MQANVVEITKTDYYGFRRVLPFIVPYPSISRHIERPSWVWWSTTFLRKQAGTDDQSVPAMYAFLFGS